MEFLSFFVGLVLGVAGCIALNWEINRRALQIYRREANAKGREAQKEYADERALALAEAVQIYRSNLTNDEKLKAGAALLVKYPSSAAWLIKQARKFQAEGLDGVLGEMGDAG